MSPSTRKLMAVPLTVLSLSAAAAAAWLFMTFACEYASSAITLQCYCLLWFAAAALSLYGGLLTASLPALAASGAGLIAFAVICMLNSDLSTAYPALTRGIEIAAPALFIAAWIFITATAFRSSSRRIRGSGWLWLTVTLTMLAVFPVYNYGHFRLCQLRDNDLLTAAGNTAAIAEKLTAYYQVNGSYPAQLEMAGVNPLLVQLPYRGQTIKYFANRGMFILTFEDPLHVGTVVYSWDTSRNGWYPADPHDALRPAPHNLFRGALSAK
ncbi:MAG: hypothetical protein LLF76_14460 [Planctomycetaceae bacterium]|nr:hypothetical protein [Planctomycetaceae bacterium]